MDNDDTITNKLDELPEGVKDCISVATIRARNQMMMQGHQLASIGRSEYLQELKSNRTDGSSSNKVRALAKTLCQLNVNCRVDQFGRIMEELDDQRLRVVEEMGFGNLKFVKGHSLNKRLAYWLMSRVNPETGCAMEIDPDNVDNLMRFNDILEWFGKEQCGKGFISIPEAKQEVLREGQLVDVVKFRVAFLVVVLGILLCPTTNFSTLASDVVPALCAADQPHDYDWCSYVLQFLMRRARSFCSNLRKDGFVVGCGGCTFSYRVSEGGLVNIFGTCGCHEQRVVGPRIFYVDHLKRPPMCWGEFPRIKAWTKDSLSKVAKDDMRTTGDYGKTKVHFTITILIINNLVPVTVDVAYGEAHPQAPRDVYPKESLGMAEEVATRIGEVLRKEMTDLKGVLENVLRGRREESSAVRSLGRGTMIARPRQQQEQHQHPTANHAATAPTSSSAQPAFANVPSTSTQAANSVRCAPIKVFRSKKTGKRVPKHLKEDDSSVQKTILDFVRRWSSKKRTAADDPVLIMCNGVNVTQSSCYGALSPLGTVDSSFVKMAGVMFNIEWAKRYKDTDARIVMDPLFGYNTFTKGKVAREAWLKEFATEVTYDGASLTMVFVPFVLQQHWTCICFALKDNSIWVIDSMYSDPLTQHERPIANLIDSMDVFLSEICRGSPWEIGQIQQWPKDSVHVDKQKDIRSCGIHMLMCMEECVDTIPEKFVLESMDEAREALLLRLLLSDLNEMKDQLETIVKG
ncbi:Ubiquitin-like-specific protease 1 [Bienertia sinuspersici]